MEKRLTSTLARRSEISFQNALVAAPGPTHEPSGLRHRKVDIFHITKQPPSNLHLITKSTCNKRYLCPKGKIPYQ